MEIKLHEIEIRDILDGYVNNGDDGIYGYGGKLNIRPAYQRGMVYDDDKQRAVIESIFKGYPLNVMYWTDDNGYYEMLDGQQRTLSICNFYETGKLDVMIDGVPKFYGNLTKDQKELFLSKKLMVYYCYGTDVERLEWFKVINTYGEKLTDQELRNAIYHGPWTTAARKLCSKRNCYCQNMLGAYMKESPEREKMLETIIKWKSDYDKIESIEKYMALHQHNENAQEIKNYITAVAEWIEKTFPEYDKTMKGIKWGELYNKYHTRTYYPEQNAKRVIELMDDAEVTKPAGIYEYLLSGDEKYLSLRAFDPTLKKQVWLKQNKKCAKCGKLVKLEEAHADHIKPWSLGGRTIESNCQVTCIDCNLKMGAKKEKK